MWAHLAREMLEPVLNRLLQSDFQSTERLQSVTDQKVGIWIKELPEPLILSFYAEGVQLLGKEYDALDATVKLSLFDLPNLSDNASATQAIQQGKIEVTGDPMLLQRAADVFKNNQIDWEELLVPYIGDIGAYMLAQPIQMLQQKMIAWQGIDVSALLSDELKILATQVDHKSLQNQIKEQGSRLEQLEKCLLLLEGKES